MTLVDSPVRIGELIGLYRRTHYGVRVGAHGDRVIRIGERAPDAIVDWLGDDRCAFYLSAENPYSEALDAAGNARLTATLRDDLDARRARFLGGDAGIPGEPWREQGFLVTMIARADALALARRYRQNAFVVVPAVGAATLALARDDWRAIASASITTPDVEAASR